MEVKNLELGRKLERLPILPQYQRNTDNIVFDGDNIAV